MLGFGWDGDLPAPVAAAAPTLRPQTAALLARMAVPPDNARAGVIDRLIGTLVDNGIWSRLDVLVVLAAHHAQAALLNWKGTSHTAATVGAPVFVADRGFYTDGSDDAIDWGWMPTNGVAFAQNSAMFGAWCRKGDRNAVSPIGTQTGTTCTLNPRSGSDVFAGRVNTNTVANAGTVATGYGLSIVDRSASTATQLYRDGNPMGSVSTGTSQARTAIALASGRAGGNFADGQFCAHLAGGSLTAAEHRILADALGTYMAAVGVAPLTAANRTLAMTTAWQLPDGARPVATGQGMAATGLARDPIDGCWWIGNGLATPESATGVSRVSPDLSSVLGSYDVAGWGLASSYNGSVQGVAFDTGDATLWAILKATSGGGAFLLHIARDGVLIGPPVALPQPSANGIAYDPATDLLTILFDGSPATVRWFTKSGTDLSSSTQVLTLPTAKGDHLFIDPASGDLFATWGDNGTGGYVGRYSRASYGGWALAGVDTLSGADAIEGVVVWNGALYVTNDAATHPGNPVANRLLRYAV